MTGVHRSVGHSSNHLSTDRLSIPVARLGTVFVPCASRAPGSAIREPPLEPGWPARTSSCSSISRTPQTGATWPTLASYCSASANNTKGMSDDEALDLVRRLMAGARQPDNDSRRARVAQTSDPGGPRREMIGEDPPDDGHD